MSVILVKPKSVSAKDKAALRKAGHIVIETDNPGNVTVLDDFGNVEKPDILECALEAMEYGGDPAVRHQFSKLFRQKLLSKIKSKVEAK